MKTKHIFGTVLMAALTAACSNEDLQLVEQSAQVGGRIELGDVTLSLGGAESRFVVGDNFNDLTAELGDKVGAALIDAPNTVGNTYDAKYNYDLTSYISTNYAYEYNGSVWTTPAKMVEGNYMFYAPYNAAHATRKPVVAKLDAVQQLVATSNGVDELSTIKQMIASGNVMAVSHEFIAASDEANIQTALVPIYAYPFITLTNNFEELNSAGTAYVAADLTVNQVVIKDGAGNFIVEAPFEFEAGKTAITADDDFVYGLRDFTYYKSSSEPNKALKGAFAKSLGKGAYTSDILGSATKESSAIVVKAPQGGLKVAKNGGSVSFYAVIPAEKYTSGLTLDVYTNKGVFTKAIAAPAISAGKRYPEAEYNNDGTATIVPSEGGEAAKGELFTVPMDSPAASHTGELVATTQDLLTLIQNSVANVNNPTLIINALTSDVEINTAVMNAIKSKNYSGWTVKFETPVTISTSLNSSNKYIVFDGGAIVKSGTITLNNKVTFNEKLNVKDGTVTINSVFDNDGSLVVNGGVANLNVSVPTSVNAGKVVVGTTTFAENIYNYGGEITFVAGTSSASKSYTFTKYVHNAKGTFTVPAYTTVNEVTKNGAADTKATLAINGTVTTVVENTAKGTIKLNGTATNVALNNGMIEMLSSSAKVKVVDNQYRINNTKNGKVEYTNGIVYYQFEADVNGKLIPKATTYNTIILKGMTWAPEAKQELDSKVTKVILTDATIEVWDADAVITISGTLTAENSDGMSSYVNGVDGSYIVATNGGSTISGIVQTGTKVVTAIPQN